MLTKIIKSLREMIDSFFFKRVYSALDFFNNTILELKQICSKLGDIVWWMQSRLDETFFNKFYSSIDVFMKELNILKVEKAREVLLENRNRRSKSTRGFSKENIIKRKLSTYRMQAYIIKRAE